MPPKGKGRANLVRRPKNGADTEATADQPVGPVPPESETLPTTTKQHANTRSRRAKATATPPPAPSPPPQEEAQRPRPATPNLPPPEEDGPRTSGRKRFPAQFVVNEVDPKYRAKLSTTLVQKKDNPAEVEAALEEALVDDEDEYAKGYEDTIVGDVTEINSPQKKIQSTPDRGQGAPRLPVKQKEKKKKAEKGEFPAGSNNGTLKQNWTIDEVLDADMLQPQMLWSLTKHDQEPGNYWWRCKYCNAHEGSHPDTLRIAQHMAVCHHVPLAVHQKCQQHVEGKLQDVKKDGRRKKKPQHHELDELWIDLVTKKGTTLDFGECEEVKAIFRALNTDWVPPTADKLSRKIPKRVTARQAAIVDQARENMHNTLISDGWGNLRGEKLLNLLIAYQEWCVMYDCKHLSKDQNDAKSLFIEYEKVITKIGKDNISAIVLDGASVNDKAKEYLKQRFPHLELLDCTSHRLNLAAGDWMDIGAIKKWIMMARKLVRWIRLHGGAREELKKWIELEAVGIQWLEPSLPAATRWQGLMQLLNFLLRLQQGIRACFKNRESPKVYKLQGKKPAEKELWYKVHAISQDDKFWNVLPMLKHLFEPLLRETIRHEAERSTMSEVFPTFCRLKAELLSMQNDPQWQEDIRTYRLPIDRMYRLLQHRANTSIHPLMLIAFLGDPVQRKLHDYQLVAREWNEVEKYLQEVEARIGKEGYANRMMNQLKRLHVYQGEFAPQKTWREGLPPAAREDLLQWRKNPTMDGDYLDAVTWWLSEFSHLPELVQLMTKALSLRCSTGPAERNWSSFGFIHSKKRNRLTTPNTIQLTFLYFNARMERRRQAQKDAAAMTLTKAEVADRAHEAMLQETANLDDRENVPKEERIRSQYLMDNNIAMDADEDDELEDAEWEVIDE